METKQKIYGEAEKFIKSQFLGNTLDYDCKFNLQQVVQDKLVADNSIKDSSEYYESKKGEVHVSSLYRCLRGVYYEMMGETPTSEIAPRVLGVFKAGNFFEDFIIESMGERMLDRQTEYRFKYKSLTLVGRDDGTFLDDKGERRVLEVKSQHSDSFWYMLKEQMGVQWQHQIQLQTYLWLRRELFQDEVDGYYAYISKDDCTINGVAVKYNRNIINEIVLPILDALSEAIDNENPELLKLPEPIIFDKGKYKTNWLCKYCSYHEKCSPMWSLDIEDKIKVKNKLIKKS
jgi:CRISPR/Cas system-associated exonuclease Cas4 (RecB family)